LHPPCVVADLDAIREAAGIGVGGYAISAQCITDSKLVSIPTRAFVDFLAIDRSAMRLVLKDICGRRTHAAWRERSELFDTPVRLANFLVDYAQRFGSSNDQGIEIELPLTWTQVANTIGVGERSVSRCISRWKKDGVLSMKDRRLIVHEITTLEFICADARFPLSYGSRMPHFVSSGTTPKTLQQLLDIARTVQLGADAPIFDASSRVNEVLLVLEGTVRCFHRVDDDELTIAMYRAPCFLGDIAAIGQSDSSGGARHVEFASSMTPVSFVAIPVDEFVQSVNHDEELMAMLLEDICARRCSATRRERARLMSAPERLANFLVEYLGWAGKPCASGIEVRPHLTWEEISRAVGITVRHVGRCMSQWKAEGSLSYHKGRLVVHDPQRIAGHVGSRLHLVYAGKGWL